MALVLNDKANELQKQYQAPRKILELCTTEKQMEDIAKDYPEVGEKPGDKKSPKFTSPGAGGVGKDFSKMSADEQLKEGFRQLNK